MGYYSKEQGRRIRFCQPITAASTAANVLGTGQATTNMHKGDFCTIQCTTGRMWFLSDTMGTVMTSTAQNGFELEAKDTVDFIAATSFLYTLSTDTAGKFQLIIWDV